MAEAGRRLWVNVSVPGGGWRQALSVFEGVHRVDGGRVDEGARSDALVGADRVWEGRRQIGPFAQRRLRVELKLAAIIRRPAVRHQVGGVAEREGGVAHLGF